MKIVLAFLSFAVFCQADPAAKMVAIPGTSYEVTDALTTVPVTVSIGEFLISPAEVTQSEFEAVTGFNPSFHKGSNLPVENVSWWDAIRYCNLRSIREGFEPCYNLATGECDLSKKGYRLPTDAEWNHASAATEVKPGAEVAPIGNLGSADTKSVERLVSDLKSTGTKAVGSYAPNRYGLHDMIGNVWEWCTDYFNPHATPQRSVDPVGPLNGLNRMIRGGSFMSTTSRWSRGYRSSMPPEYRSRFTGFRVCRTGDRSPNLPPAHRDARWLDAYNQAPAGFEKSTGDLSPLVAGPAGAVTSVSNWQNRRAAIEAKWMKLLGAPEIKAPAPAVKLIETVHDQNYTGKLMYLQVEPDYWEKIYVLMPANSGAKPLPVVIVPYYDVDTPAGKNLGGRSSMPAGVVSFAYAAVQQGYMAVAIRWFGESYGEWYSEAVANLKLRHPNCTGLGKWVWDSHRLLDYLYTLPEVDRRNIGIIGHSLGSKMAVYAAAFDERITTVVASEGGIGLPFSNYEDYWYFGDFIKKVDKATDHHELLGLIAPRPFLLIGGDEYDTDKSWYYINAARQVYGLYGKSENIGYFNHRKGHTPTSEAVWRSMEWLRHFLGPVNR